MVAFYFAGFLGISLLYWAILAFLIALVSLFIRIPPFALPRNPSNWIFKKFILHYFHIAAWLIIAWVCYRLYYREGDISIWLYILIGIAAALMLTFITVWMIDRFQIRKMKEQNDKNKTTGTGDGHASEST